MDKKACDICYQISCKVCDWVASEEEILAIQKGTLSACPQCGWAPQK